MCWAQRVVIWCELIESGLQEDLLSSCTALTWARQRSDSTGRALWSPDVGPAGGSALQLSAELVDLPLEGDDLP